MIEAFQIFIFYCVPVAMICVYVIALYRQIKSIKNPDIEKRNKIVRFSILAGVFILFIILFFIPMHTSTTYHCDNTMSSKGVSKLFWGVLTNAEENPSSYEKWLTNENIDFSNDWKVVGGSQYNIYTIHIIYFDAFSNESLPIPEVVFEKIIEKGMNEELYKFHSLYSTGDRRKQLEAIELLYAAWGKSTPRWIKEMRMDINSE